METLEARFQIVTPMFLGGADQGVADGIRPPSVKGALRFWWRALNWGRVRAQASCDEAALILLHSEESRLFGAAGNDNGGGQGCFLLSVRPDELKTTTKGSIHPQFAPTRKITIKGETKIDTNHLGGARYLGYGLMEAFSSSKKQKEAGQLTRSCINEQQDFTVKLAFRGAIDPTITEAVKVLGMLGGLGSRSRHGFGSIALVELCDGDEVVWTAPEKEEEYRQQLKELLTGGSMGRGEPPFSAFIHGSRVDTLCTGSSCYEIMDYFGKAMVIYRSWGKFEKALGVKAEKRFDDDHGWCKANHDERKLQYSDFHPVRVVFGLPHDYGKPASQKVNGEKHERRSSPLAFHVHPVGNTFVGVSVYLPAQFLPQGEKIKAGESSVPANIEWSVITCFLDGNTGNPPGSTKRFPNRLQVIP